MAVRRAFSYTPAQWAELDRMDVDPKHPGQTGMLADLLMCNKNRIHDAIAAVGPNVGKIRRWVRAQPQPNPKPSRWRKRG